VEFIKQFDYSPNGWDNATIEKGEIKELSGSLAEIAIDNGYATVKCKVVLEDKSIVGEVVIDNTIKEENKTPITTIKGLGKATEKKMNALGVYTIDDFRKMTKKQVKAVIDIQGVSANDLALWNAQVEAMA